MISTLSRPRQTTLDAARLVSWIFQRNGHALTCQVDAGATPSSYDVCIVPHWDVAAAAIETVKSPVKALRLHAEIVKQLQEAGWLLTHRTAARARA
jgi:hypothetical protein